MRRDLQDLFCGFVDKYAPIVRDPNILVGFPINHLGSCLCGNMKSKYIHTATSQAGETSPRKLRARLRIKHHLNLASDLPRRYRSTHLAMLNPNNHLAVDGDNLIIRFLIEIGEL